MDASALNAFNDLVLSVLVMTGMAAGQARQAPPPPEPRAAVEIDRCGRPVVPPHRRLEDPTCGFRMPEREVAR